MINKKDYDYPVILVFNLESSDVIMLSVDPSSEDLKWYDQDNGVTV